MGGGSSSPPPAPTFSTYGGQPNYIPQFQSASDVNLNNLYNQMYGSATSLPGQVLPQLANLSNNLVNNPYAPAAQTAANNASSYLSGTVVPMEQAGANQLTALGNQAVPYAGQILSTGFDPQNALYNRTQQQLTDQLNASLASQGLSGTPYGAGVAGQTLSNFNIDWQNNELQRQLAAAQGYGNLTGTIGRDLTGGSALGTQAGQTITGAGSLPYATSIGQTQTGIGGLGALTSGTGAAYQPAQTLAQDYANYLGLGNQASATTDQAILGSYNQQLAAWNAAQQANSGFLGGLGGLVGGVADAFSTGGFFGGGGPGGTGGFFDLSNLFGPASAAVIA